MPKNYIQPFIKHEAKDPATGAPHDQKEHAGSRARTTDTPPASTQPPPRERNATWTDGDLTDTEQATIRASLAAAQSRDAKPAKPSEKTSPARVNAAAKVTTQRTQAKLSQKRPKDAKEITKHANAKLKDKNTTLYVHFRNISRDVAAGTKQVEAASEEMAGAAIVSFDDRKPKAE